MLCPPSLIRVFTVHSKDSKGPKGSLCGQQRLIRLGGCPGWSVFAGSMSFRWFCQAPVHVFVGNDTNPAKRKKMTSWHMRNKSFCKNYDKTKAHLSAVCWRGFPGNWRDIPALPPTGTIFPRSSAPVFLSCLISYLARRQPPGPAQYNAGKYYCKSQKNLDPKKIAVIYSNVFKRCRHKTMANSVDHEGAV